MGKRFRQEITSGNGPVRDFEVKLRRRDGTEMYGLITATIRFDNKDGGLVGVQGSVRDITRAK